LAIAGGVAALTASAAADTIILNYVVTNTSNATQTFTITDNIAANVGGPTFISGSVTGTVTDLNGNGATVATSPAGSSIYSALIDLGTVRTLMDPGFSFSAGNFLSATGGPQSFALEPSIAVTAFIGITLTFTLTAGDSASFTSIFTVVPIPAPGAAVALCGLAGSVALGRRRRS
jgi:hypothetical protein